MAVKKYNVQWTLNHDGKEYQAGEQVSLEEKTAKPLIDAGVLVDPTKKQDEAAGE